MLTAHLPSGYLVGRLAEKSCSGNHILIAALIGAVLPDVDMLYFHFVDFGRTHHHMYVSHWPLAWLVFALPVICVLHFMHAIAQRNIAIVLFGAVMLHLCLDSIAAPIFWLMPIMKGQLELVSVPARYSHWIISYLLHWTFALELAIWLAAILAFMRVRKASTAP